MIGAAGTLYGLIKEGKAEAIFGAAGAAVALYTYFRGPETVTCTADFPSLPPGYTRLQLFGHT